MTRRPGVACECSKRLYTRAQAVQVAARLNANAPGAPVPMMAYRCPFLRAWWHVGHERAKAKTSRAERREAVRAKPSRGAQ